MDEQYIRNRITALRLKKNISEYKMSLDLGHSRSYIQNISSGKAMPSMSEFLNICDYMEITPSAFFREEEENPSLIQAILNRLQSLPDSDLLLILRLVERISRVEDQEQQKNG